MGMVGMKPLTNTAEVARSTMKPPLLLGLALVLAAAPALATTPISPHLTLTGDPTSMIVSWAVLDSTQDATVTPHAPAVTSSRVAWGE